MSATTVKLLKAASEIVGGNRTLALRLGIGERLLSQFMADDRELPDLLLLRAVDIILSDRPGPLSLSRSPRATSSRCTRSTNALTGLSLH
jgi:hypothetical protein